MHRQKSKTNSFYITYQSSSEGDCHVTRNNGYLGSGGACLPVITALLQHVHYFSLSDNCVFTPPPNV